MSWSRILLLTVSLPESLNDKDLIDVANGVEVY